VAEAEPWVRAVIREAGMRGERFAPFDTVYLGGGTPSVLEDRQLEALLLGLRATLRIETGAEITLEINPGDVSGPRARRFRNMGISRASVGVQSFDDHVLRFLGRRHDASTALRALSDLRNAGFPSIGFDLIWAVPGQSRDRAWASVELAIGALPDHLACYQLSIEAGTPLERDVLAGAVIPVRDDEAADRAGELWSRLDEAGYDHYEVSSFARGADHRSRHNRKYWQHVPYLGLGPAAHSFDGKSRWANARSVGEYVVSLNKDVLPMAFEEHLTSHQLHCERVALGLRTSDGVDATSLDRDRLEPYVREGLLVLVGGRVVPTARGMLVADGLARELLST